MNLWIIYKTKPRLWCLCFFFSETTAHNEAVGRHYVSMPIMTNLDAEFSHVLNSSDECIVAGFQDLDFSANTRFIEWPNEAVLFTKLFDRHCRLCPYHRVDPTDCTRHHRRSNVASRITINSVPRGEFASLPPPIFPLALEVGSP